MSKVNDKLVEARELLGVDASASSAEIRKAYKKAALQHHPDKGGDPERFKAVRLAAEVLISDSGQRESEPSRGPQGCITPGCSAPGYMVHANGKCGECNKVQDYRDFNLQAIRYDRIVKMKNGKFGKITSPPTPQDHLASLDLLDGGSIWVDAKTLTKCYDPYGPSEERACLEDYDRLLKRRRKESAVKANEDKGKLAAGAGNWEEAVEAYQAAVDLMPADQRLSAALVEAEEQKKKKEEEELERKVKQWPRFSALGAFGPAAKAKKAEIDKQEQEKIANAWAQAWPVSPAVGGGKLKQKRGKNKKNRTKKKSKKKQQRKRR